MKALPFIASAVALLSACTGAQTDNNYYVKANVGPDFNGKTAYLYDIDRDTNIDSAIVTDSTVIFNAPMTEGYNGTASVILSIDDNNIASFFLEADSITITEGIAKGGQLNQRIHDYWSERIASNKEYMELPDSLKQEKRDYYIAKSDSLDKAFLEANLDNALGVQEILRDKRPYSLAEIDSLTGVYPILNGNARLEKIRKAFKLEEETSVGKMFKDFVVTSNDSTFRLSDVVGKGKYVLVDFWASWCGPCIRQTAVIKDLYKQYADKGLEVIGVAVWDEPEATIEAVKRHDLPWRNIINAQHIPSDIYGFQGIPCIILFGPDGTILSRDQQDEGLRNDVANAINGK